MQFDIKQLVESEKTLATNPKWLERDSRSFRLSSSLDIEGVTVEGLELIASAFQTLPERAVMFQLQFAPPNARFRPLQRVEWNPLKPHTNPNVGPQHLRLQRLSGSHVHGFYDNFIENDNRMRSGNLPIAELLDPNPSTFGELLDVIGKLFRIDGIMKIEEPPWTEGDLFWETQ